MAQYAMQGDYTNGYAKIEEYLICSRLHVGHAKEAECSEAHGSANEVVEIGASHGDGDLNGLVALRVGVVVQSGIGQGMSA